MDFCVTIFYIETFTRCIKYILYNIYIGRYTIGIQIYTKLDAIHKHIEGGM